MAWIKFYHWALPVAILYTRHNGRGWEVSYSRLEIGVLCFWLELEWVWKSEKVS